MKKMIFILVAGILFSVSLYAQKTSGPLEVFAAGSFAKPKIVPKLNAFGVAQVTVHYKLTTQERAIGKEKSSGAVAGAKLAAYLETTDGNLTDEDFQEITDHFYTYLQARIKSVGIETIAWDKITATDFYKTGVEKNEPGKGSWAGNEWVSYIANHGTNMYGGGLAFAMGKMKKASKFCDEIGAPAGFFHVVVDFADVMVDVNINTSTSGVFTVEKTRSFNYNSAVKPEMKVVPSTIGSTLIWNDKMQSESINVVGDLPAAPAYHDNISQDPSRMKNNPFRFAKEMLPVVIETTREKYKTAAKKALENYADEFVATVVKLKD